MKRTLQILGVVVLALVGVASTQATPLSVLLAGGSITAGDKVFDQWSLIQFLTTDPGRIFDASNIEVTALIDGGLNPGPGLAFAVASDELSVTGDGIYNFVDLAFGFHVTAAPGLLIKDNSLAMTGSLVTNSTGGFEDLGMTILEWVSDTGLVLDPSTPGYIKTELSALSGVVTPAQPGASTFSPRQDYWVTKDILVWAVNSAETAALTNFTQRFSQQTVPEPATLALLSLGLAGLAFTRRRRG